MAAAKIIPNPNYEERVRASFARQNAMATIGAELTLVTPGIVEIEMPFAGAYPAAWAFCMPASSRRRSISACGFAAFSLMPENAAVLTIEFKVNLLAPGRACASCSVAQSPSPAVLLSWPTDRPMPSARTRKQTHRDHDGHNDDDRRPRRDGGIEIAAFSHARRQEGPLRHGGGSRVWPASESDLYAADDRWGPVEASISLTRALDELKAAGTLPALSYRWARPAAAA